jgi:hypothetical protein
LAVPPPHILYVNLAAASDYFLVLFYCFSQLFHHRLVHKVVLRVEVEVGEHLLHPLLNLVVFILVHHMFGLDYFFELRVPGELYFYSAGPDEIFGTVHQLVFKLFFTVIFGQNRLPHGLLLPEQVIYIIVDPIADFLHDGKDLALGFEVAELGQVTGLVHQKVVPLLHHFFLFAKAQKQMGMLRVYLQFFSIFYCLLHLLKCYEFLDIFSVVFDDNVFGSLEGHRLLGVARHYSFFVLDI